MLEARRKPEPLAALSGAGVFRDGRWLVRGVDLTIRPGEIVTLIGPNGSGKSTTARMTTGVLKPDEGRTERRDGLSIIESLRAEGDNTPVLILSALGEVDDRVTGLRAGGDDYLVKPYAFSELLARIEVMARRTAPSEAATSYQVADLVLDRLARKVERGGETVVLQPREFRLLEYLMKNAGRVVTRTMLLENVWDYHFDPQTNVIDVHMSRLRAKVDKGHQRQLLQTVRGAGYVIRD